MQIRTEDGWRQAGDLAITPDLREIAWGSPDIPSVFRRKRPQCFDTLSHDSRLT
jgi:hypothetical protein